MNKKLESTISNFKDAYSDINNRYDKVMSRFNHAELLNVMNPQARQRLVESAEEVKKAALKLKAQATALHYELNLATGNIDKVEKTLKRLQSVTGFSYSATVRNELIKEKENDNE